MADSLAALVLAAGKGERLRPLTLIRPKALCPVANIALVDLAIGHLVPLVDAGPASVAVNVHHRREQLEAHLAGRVHVSVEDEAEALGTAGAVAHLRPWLDGRPVVVVNADTWHRIDLRGLVRSWDGERVRVMMAAPSGAPFGPRSRVVGSVLPWKEVAGLAHEPSGLWEASWRHRLSDGNLDVVSDAGPTIDCGTPGNYLAANLAASGGASVVGPGSVVEGELVRSVVWPGGVVRRGEVLVDAIRVGESLTVRPR